MILQSPLECAALICQSSSDCSALSQRDLKAEFLQYVYVCKLCKTKFCILEFMHFIQHCSLPHFDFAKISIFFNFGRRGLHVASTGRNISTKENSEFTALFKLNMADVQNRNGCFKQCLAMSVVRQDPSPKDILTRKS